MSTLDKISSYMAIRLGLLSFLFLRISYALSQREQPVAKSSIMSATWSVDALWDTSVAALAPVLFGERCNAVSDVVEGTGAESEAEASVVNRWMARIAVVDGAACLEGWRTFARAC